MTPAPAGYRAVDLPETRHADIAVLDTWAFPGSMTDEQFMALPLPLSWERTRGIEAEDGELVAMHSSYPFSRFGVPGGTTPVAGLTWVGVHPAHRRRGLLRSMITEHFERSLARGEAVSALFAAEAPIYGRFGYGLAADDLRLTVPRGAALRDVAGADQVRVRIERLEAEKHAPVLRAVHASVARPGWATRETPQLEEAFLSDPEAFRDGAESLRVALAERDGAVVGYSLFRRKSSWEAAGPRGVVRLREVVTPDPAVARALWGVLTDLDLMAKVEAWPLPIDDPILHLLVDRRAAEPRFADNVWVRLLDVPAALVQRRYSAPADVVLEVTDAMLPANAGRWRLTADLDEAQVQATEDAPDLTLDVRALGSAYLGGVSLASLATAGLVVEQTPGALHAASVAFAWPLAPVCSWVF